MLGSSCLPLLRAPRSLTSSLARGLVVLAMMAAAACGEPFTANGTSTSTSTSSGTRSGTPDASTGGSAASKEPVTLVSGETLPRAITVDDTRLFWTNAEDSGGGPGLVRTMPKDGTAGATTVAANQDAPLDVAVDDAGLFWSVGGTPGAANQMQCLAMRADKASLVGPMCVVSAAATTARLALDTTSIALLTKDAAGFHVGVVPKTGAATLMSVVTQGPSQAIVATDTAVYVGNQYGPHVDTYALPGLTIGPNACGTDCGGGLVADLAIDHALGRVYWATTTGEVVVGPVPPPVANGTTLATVQGTPQRIARDAAYVYVASQPDTIWAVPTAGGAPIALATNEKQPFGIAVDATRVYWTCGDGTIRAVAVPSP